MVEWWVLWRKYKWCKSKIQKAVAKLHRAEYTRAMLERKIVDLEESKYLIEKDNSLLKVFLISKGYHIRDVIEFNERAHLVEE